MRPPRSTTCNRLPLRSRLEPPQQPQPTRRAIAASTTLTRSRPASTRRRRDSTSSTPSRFFILSLKKAANCGLFHSGLPFPVWRIAMFYCAIVKSCRVERSRKMPHELPKAYDPAAIEDRWAEYWVKERLFDQPSPAAEDVSLSDAERSRRTSMPADSAAAKPFTILLPPPNVTGRLHMGHMFEQTEMDILTRWHRMLGDRALWVPGTDHAGIATQLRLSASWPKKGRPASSL